MRPKGRRRRREEVAENGGDGGDGEDAAVRDALASAVAAVALAAAVDGEVATDADDLVRMYTEQRWRLPLETAMAATAQLSLANYERRDRRASKRRPSDSAARIALELADLDRLIASSASKAVRVVLEGQTSRKRAAWSSGKPVSPDYLQIKPIPEDPLEARYDSNGNAVQLRKNVMGEAYAPYHSVLRFTRGRTAVEIFSRMKKVMREDLRTRDQRRIAALNAQALANKKKLEQMGYISAEAALEARFDYKFTAAGQHRGSVETN